MLFNLNGGQVKDRPLIRPQTLAEIQSPQVVARTDPSCPTPNAAYAMGWFVDVYHGRARLTHGGNLHDVNSDVSLYPEQGIGVVCFFNFGSPGLAKVLSQSAYDLLEGLETEHTFETQLLSYERNIEETRRRTAAVPRVENTAPSHPLGDYVGTYVHPGYGAIEIRRQDEELVLQRNNLVLPLQHWHYDAWVVKDPEAFVIHVTHPFDRGSRWQFETSVDGAIVALSIRLEPAVASLRFEKTEAQ
jgi:hypothetical protein